MTTIRRTFLQQGSAALAGAALSPRAFRRSPSVRLARRGGTPGLFVDPAIRIETDPRVKELALRAVDAAKAAGATYADARLTRTLTRSGLTDTEEYSLGVRALVNGTWGFAASPYWRAEEATQLAKDATAQAKANAAGTVRPVELGTLPAVTGSWIMPVRIDPFTVPMEEMWELTSAWSALSAQLGRDVGRYENGGGAFETLYFVRQERAVASTEGSYFTQTTWRSSFTFRMGYKLFFHPRAPGDTRDELLDYSEAQGLGYQTAGWEAVLDAKVDEQFPRLLEEAKRKATQPPLVAKPGDVGRYDVVFDAATMASLVEGSLGGPTQLDRALGYEANATGTSYVTDPLGMVGKFQIGSPLLNITADRIAPRSLAWVKWDDEGVTPEAFPLVKDGVLTDFQTTREMAGYLKEYYVKAGLPQRSHGCAYADTASEFPMAHTPNLTLHAGQQDVSFDDMVRDTKKGMAVTTESFGFDFQGLSGMGGSMFRLIREINNGRLGPVVSVVVPFFNSLEIWKNLQVLGGPSSVAHTAMQATKGQPAQSSWHTVTVVPAKFTNVAFIDPARKG